LSFGLQLCFEELFQVSLDEELNMLVRAIYQKIQLVEEKEAKEAKVCLESELSRRAILQGRGPLHKKQLPLGSSRASSLFGGQQQLAQSNGSVSRHSDSGIDVDLLASTLHMQHGHFKRFKAMVRDSLRI
jgi:hypothetical protein